MNKYCAPILCAAIFTTSSSISFADSLRCKTKFTHIGDTKSEVLDKCGYPVMADNFCQPAAAASQAQGIQNGNSNAQNNIAIAACENIDIWTYNPGKGKFITHLYFSGGQLQSIRYGDRVK